MTNVVRGVVKNGVIVPKTALPENAQVEIRLSDGAPEAAVDASTLRRWTPAELRKLPRDDRQAILATAAAIAEHDYATDKELTGFDAFSEEELNDDESDSDQG